jgi:hypothetical protein
MQLADGIRGATVAVPWQACRLMPTEVDQPRHRAARKQDLPYPPPWLAGLERVAVALSCGWQTHPLASASDVQRSCVKMARQMAGCIEAFGPIRRDMVRSLHRRAATAQAGGSREPPRDRARRQSGDNAPPPACRWSCSLENRSVKRTAPYLLPFQWPACARFDCNVIAHAEAEPLSCVAHTRDLS